ncbi:four-carbon acid sugar kinase family protein [Limosilactobacillus sp.]|uniref:four-carbon acid sugar kinase family protein n=1 Tax=Limosilactobacillus sp. TaxID=2773925 RepID=UPI00345ED882
MTAIGVIADDLTGATTVGTLLARAGIKTAAYFSPDDMPGADQYQAIVMTTDSRHMKAEDADAAVTKVMKKLQRCHVDYFTKRIDTTYRGGLGTEIDAMLRQMPADTMAMVVPAMPQSKRILAGGYAIIENTALEETEVAHDVLTPVTETFIPKLIAGQTHHKVGVLDLETVLAGPAAVKEVLERRQAEGCRVIVCDSVSMAHVQLIANSVVELGWSTLAVDPGPFTYALALAHGLGQEKADTTSDNASSIDPEESGHVLVVAGSATGVTRKQIDYLAANDTVDVISVDPRSIVMNDRLAHQMITAQTDRLLASLSDPATNVTILETAVYSPVLDLKQVEAEDHLPSGQASANINLAVAQIVHQALAEWTGHLDGLYMTGGDTMVTTLKHLGAKGIGLRDYVIPQTDLGQIIGGDFAGTFTIGKGGMTGKEDTAVVAVNRCFAESRQLVQQKVVTL